MSKSKSRQGCKRGNKGWDEEIAKRKAIDKLHVVGKGISQVIEEFLVNAKRERLEKEMNTG